MVKGIGGRRSTPARTREALLQAGEAVFSERGYHEASVSEICRRAGLANGTFYRHFEHKEEIFAALVERLQNGMRERIQRALAEAADGRDALLQACRDVLHYIARESALYRVGRGAEAIRLGIHRQFRMNLAEALGRVLRAGVESGVFRAVDETTAAYAILGMLEFMVMRYILWEPGSLHEGVYRTLECLVMSGFDTGTARVEGMKRPPVGAEPRQGDPADTLQGGEATRQALLDAAERLFGQTGFYQTSVSAITYVAGVAQGTFYLHFPSKVAIFAELAREINRKFRAAERAALAGIVDRREVEVAGFQAFFRFIAAHRGAYWIIREAELIDPETGRWYYERLARGYTAGLSQAMERGEVYRMAPEPLSYALLGAGHSVALWWLADDAKPVPADRVVCALLDFLERGLLDRNG
ncbi:MAG: TetR/AcrR family transcriptional regulator [Candidatus Bipolaricaulota bacterium]